MAPDDRISIRENASYQYEVFNGKKWLATFQYFKDAAEFGAKQTIAKEHSDGCPSGDFGPCDCFEMSDGPTTKY